MARANAIQLVNLALVPLCCFMLPRLSPSTMVAIIGAFWTVIACGALIDVFRTSPPARLSRVNLLAAGRELLVYGGPRVPGEVALGALFALPVTIAAHLGGIVVAGHVGLAVSVLTMAGSVFSPFGQILLPSISGISSGPRLLRIRVALRQLLLLCLGLTGLFVAFVELFAPFLLRLVVGPEFASAVPAVRVVVLAAPAYVAYVILRNVLDALHVRPLNAKNLTAAVCVLAGLSFTTGTAAAVPLAIFVSIIVLGALSAWDAHRCLASADDELDSRADAERR
jgi:O-antigen/teichoic acid export membrane protein